MKGVVYGVGVGPGDPELMTLKAVRLIREGDVIALPGSRPRETAAYRIAAAAVPELADKALVPIDVPMLRDRAALDRAHRAAAVRLERYLDAGQSVVYLTLGDPSLYSSFGYIQHYLEADGYRTAMVPGVPSFCAAAARLNVPLAQWDAPLHVLPAAHETGAEPDLPGACVLMKPAGRMQAIKDALRASGRGAMMVENCGMAGERVYRNAEAFPDDAGYFSLIIAGPTAQHE